MIDPLGGSAMLNCVQRIVSTVLITDGCPNSQMYVSSFGGVSLTYYVM